jgi:hypothetical protein
MASTYLTYTQQSPSTAEGQKFTLSMWVKKSANEERQGLYGNTYSNTHRAYIYFDVSDRLSYYDSGGVNYITNRKFRDNNAFYHIVVSVDTTLSTSSDRVKIYVNGVRETSFAASSAPNQNETLKIMNTTNTPYMGRYLEAGTSRYLQGVISHAHLTQGYVYDATPFGETDSTTGEWKIKTSVTGVTYGTNGFWWLKDTIATTDHSPNSNTFTVAGGTLTKTEDSPSNVFATLNPLSSLSTFSYGNTEAEFSSGSGYQTTTTTLGMTSGKYYCEAKVTVNGNYPGFGICETNSPHASKLDTANWLGSSGGGFGWYVGTTSGNAIYDNGTGYTAPTSFSTNDIIGMAIDLDTAQNTLKYYKNGALVQTLQIATSSNGWLFGVTHNTNQTPARSKFNFGNGYFRSTAVSSAGTNASNNGIFEYDVPSGYTALSTRGLNT